MAVLSNVLPGVRDVRTPLVTGYAWLIALWLLCFDREPFRRAGAHLAVVFAPVSGTLGTGGLVGLTAVAAYLLGGLLARDPDVPPLLPSVNWFLAHPLEWSRRRSPDSDQKWIQDVFDMGRARRYRRIDTLRFADFVVSARDGKASHLRDSRDFGDVETALDGFDHSSAAIRLHLADKSLWDQYDRLRAEAELRFSLAPALIGIAVGGLRVEPWVSPLCALLGWALYSAADSKARLANGVLVQCLVAGAIAQPDLLRKPSGSAQTPADNDTKGRT